MKILVSGSSGLIGSEVCSYFSNHGHQIYGIDNNQRAVFFGPQGDTSWRLKELKATLPTFYHHGLDIRTVPKFSISLKMLNRMQLFILQHNPLMTRQPPFHLTISM